MNIGVAY